MEALEKKIRAVCVRIFKDFSKRVGLDDIAEHDKKMHEARQAREEQLGSLRRQVDELELERKNLSEAVADLDDKIRTRQKKDKVRFTSAEKWG